MAQSKPAESTALTTVTDSDYVALSLDTRELTESLQDSLGSEGFGPNDFDTLTVPSGAGSPVWNLPDTDQPPKELKGVIIHHALSRVLWLTPLDEAGGQNQPPDCSGKVDPDTGLMVGKLNRAHIAELFNVNAYVRKPNGDVAMPTGAAGSQRQTCDDCPFAAWKTARKGDGQYCSMKRNVYMLLPEQPFPVVIRVPATSLKGARKYFVDLSKKLLTPSKVETKLSLHKEAGPPAYYVIDFNKGNNLELGAAKKAAAYGNALKPFIEKVETVLTESSQAATFAFEEEEDQY